MENDKHDQSDEELMILYQAGDFAAFEVLYRRHSGRILGYLKKKVPLETAKDIMQDTFTKLHLAKDKYDPQYPFLPWLFTVSRNTLFDFFKKAETKIAQATSAEPGLIESLPAVPTFAPEYDMSQIISGLPQDQKRAVELRYLQDWSFEKIAGDLKTSEDNVRQLVSRGIKKIRLLVVRKRGSDQ